VWQNVSDLPATATVTSTIEVMPSATVFPVGTDDLGIAVTSYTSNNATLLPAFDGSTSVALNSNHTSRPGTDAASADVRALRVTKSEPSPEQELLRGVHNNTTTYTIVVENTGEDATNGVTVTDYLPAGLEYLGVGGEDHTDPASYLFPSGGSGTLEYPGASPLTSTPAPAGGPGAAPGPGWDGFGETVETVSLDAAQATALGLPGAGVYTKVTWTIGALSGGTPQSFATTEGTAGEYTIRYRAAVPLFENTMDWPGTTPDITGEQGSNLGNNTGASTRHGINDPDYNYAQHMTNTVGVVGTYQGTVTNPGDEVSSDDDQVTIEAVDLRVIKRVNPDSFATGNLALYRLDLATSEYTSAAGITLTDEIANGLCPAFPSQPTEPVFMIDGDVKTLIDWNNEVGAECDYPNASGTVQATGTTVTVTSIDFSTMDGSFTVDFAVGAVTAQASAVIQYAALQRHTYIPGTSHDGATSSGDTMVNYVEVRGTTTQIPALDDVESASGAQAYGDETVLDDSTAEIHSNFSGLTKTVLQRDKNPGTASPADWVDHATEPFALGDTVWYRVRIDFAEDIETRQPKLTDFLPQGVEYVTSSYTAHLGTVDPAYFGDYIPAAPTQNGNVLTWLLGDQNQQPASDDRFIPIGSWIEFTIEGRVVGQSASSSEVDKPENQAKYQQENVDGDVFFLRDEAAIDLDYGASLVAKGVRDVNGNSTLPATSQSGPDGTVFGSNRDGITVKQTDVVTYRLDLIAPETDLKDIVIWDALPVGIRAADVDPNPASFTAATVERVGLGSWNETPLVTGFTAEVVNPGDPGYPTGDVAAAYTARSLIKWTISATIPGSDSLADTVRVLTLGYKVTIPDGTVVDGGDEAEITQDYVNDASITNYAVINNWTGMNGDSTSTLVPEPGSPGQVSTILPGPTQFEVPSDGTYDPSNVTVRDASFAKTLVSTEIAPTGTTPADTNNPANAIAQGEYATFEYSVTVPAHTSVSNLQLSDGGAFGYPAPGFGSNVTYQYLAGSAQFFGPSNSGSTPDTCGAGELTGFTCAETDGATHGVLGYSGVYQNDTATDQVFRVRITVWVKDRDESNLAYNPNLANNTQLRNTATFRFDDPDSTTGGTISRTANAQVQYREPVPTLTKTVTDPATGIVGADGNVTFRLTAGNTASRVALYDTIVYDCVPAGFSVPTPAFAASQGSASVVAGGCTVTGTGTAQRVVPGGGVGTLIEWTVGRLDGGQTETLDFTAKVDSTAGGGASYTNRAHIIGYTLPDTLDPTDARRGDRATGADAPVTLSQATLTKSVTTPNGLGSAPVGETVRYTVTVNLPANANFYDVTLTDTLPAGVSFAGNQDVTFSGWPVDPLVTGPVDPNSQNLSWTIAPDDIPLLATARTITIAFDATITSSVSSSAASVTNTAQFAWNTVDGGGTRLTDDDTAVVTILNPLLGIVKDVKFSEEADTAYRQQAQGGPDRDLTYRVTVTNTGNTPAYNATFTDTIPAGVVVDGSSISPAGVLSGNDPTTGGGLITWTVAGPIGVGAGNAITFTYDAVFAPSADLASNTNGQGDLLTNTARVTHYESFPSGGRSYDPTTVQDTAEARALFPYVTLTKAVADTTHTAYVGEPFEWVLTATNSGLGDAQKVVLTDTLPANWTFTAVTSITVAGVAQALTNPTGPAGGPLVWTFGADANAVTGLPVAILAPGQSIVIHYTATPTNPDAIANPGVGSANPHTNKLDAVTTDRQNATRDHTGPEATDDAFLREADLLLVKDAIGGVVDSGTGQPDNLYGLPTGTWVPGQAVSAGVYDQPQWQITVTNQGPDAGFGPFRVVDTQTLPTGVTTGSWSARYFSGPSDTTGTALTVTGTGTSGDPFVVGTTSTSLKADGSDRIVLTANLTIAAGATATGTELSNTADVRGRTYEDPANFGDNEDDADKPLTPIADLAIIKAVTSPVPPTTPIVGSTITWELRVSNLGPSASASTVLNPIVITDTIPAGVTGVTASSNANWLPTVTRGGVASTFPAEAGDVVTWTYQGTAMPLGATAAVSLTGTILPSHTGTLTNSAEVEPGDTPDPVTPNNEDDVTVTPDDSTRLTITKTRVVPDGLGGWRQADPATDPTDAFVAGDPVHYRITVTNAGPADARNVTVVDEVPTGLTYQTHESIVGTWAHASGGTTSTGTNAGWDTFTLSGTQASGGANATSFVVTYDTATTITGGIVNWAEVTADNWDPSDPGGPYDRDDDDTDSTRIVDLGIVKTHTGSGPFTPGTELEYTLVVTNHGPSATNGVIVIEDSLPAGMTYVANSAIVAVTGGTPAAGEPALSGTGNRVLTWNALTAADTFDVGDTITVTFRALIDPKVRASVLLANTAEVDAPTASRIPTRTRTRTTTRSRRVRPTPT